VDEELTEITIHFSMRSTGNDRDDEAVAELNDRITNLQFTQDVPIWENKIYRDRPPLTRVDGPVAQYRRWFRQFYSGWDASNGAADRTSTVADAGVEMAD
jgi:3-ketosteroid 9alpha-monooxygenase subunit A